jgi:hypothetical protein
VNPGDSGWTWLKRSRLGNSIRERVAMHVLMECGRTPPWPVTAPKHVTFLGHVHTLFDDDRFPLAVAPYRDGVMDCGLFSPQRLVKKLGSKHFGEVARGRGDAPVHGHVYKYAQAVSRGKNAKRGVEITIRLRDVEGG